MDPWVQPNATQPHPHSCSDVQPPLANLILGPWWPPNPCRHSAYWAPMVRPCHAASVTPCHCILQLSITLSPLWQRCWSDPDSQASGSPGPVPIMPSDLCPLRPFTLQPPDRMPGPDGAPVLFFLAMFGFPLSLVPLKPFWEPHLFPPGRFMAPFIISLIHFMYLISD